jgi:hypothetical protein
MMLGRGMHYAQVERLRRAALLYQAAYRTNYFEDLYQAHADVGCGFTRADGVRVLANLTPIKESEVVLITPTLDGALRDAIYDALRALRDQLGVTSFNLAIYQPPLARPEAEENWDGFPTLVRIVDRGDPSSRTADFGAMELYAASVVSADPFHVVRVLRAGM